MEELWHIIRRSYIGYEHYLISAIKNPFPKEGINFFYLLIVLSLLVWGLEIALPWRKKQPLIRRGFWVDTFYMFFNFFIFNLLLFVALSNTTGFLFSKLMSGIGLPEGGLIDLAFLPVVAQLLVYFLLYDFTQWCVHVLLHRVPALWRFHKVHHSVREMGFAAHLRFHFMELFVYKPALFIVLAYTFHFQLEYGFIIHIFALTIGHLNHANLGWDYGPLKYLLNNPKMHIWHHAKNLPASHPYGMNFGITLSIWDYIFRTNYVPHEGRDIELGFEKVEEYPENFLSLQIQPFKKEQ